MGRQREYQHLMEQIRRAHHAFASTWANARAAALKDVPTPGERWARIWEANGVAYKRAEPLSQARDQLLKQLFRQHLPRYQDFLAGQPDAVSAVIDFLEVDVLAYRTGYAKEDCLRKLKTIPLTPEHQDRLRQYALRLCALPRHRREIAEAGRLMIRLADRDFLDQLHKLTRSDDPRIRKKSLKMLHVVQNGRKDLR